MEAIFDLEVGSWTLPKYIPLNPVVINKRSMEEFKMNVVGSCKIIYRCKNALEILVTCSSTLIENSEINIRNIINQVNNWFSGLHNFLTDIIENNECGDLKLLIDNTKEIVNNWENIHQEWLSKWLL